MTGYLTTHVLDTARGLPAAGMRIRLYRLDGDRREALADMTTNADGRTDTPILPATAFAPGDYELVFEAGAYLRAAKAPDGFLDLIPLRFRMEEAAHYHVPLLLSPFGYSTYRGS
ncbi:hydroxyisourate hydrolase [Roseicyclus mahoneyensis]|uniref:5-hydroxyisourate hydrolase n=1 Tax=Roseicyclus mahoneyensis TaxID=164332 RepID=A0A316GP40_9RHOB|nr:hydroxyisourate hydrolase [Roseicyclus mahoneyensis]PWK62917.1 5-hydroxyisourate hydrolase [Roseicyclus mahoneyensis]